VWSVSSSRIIIADEWIRLRSDDCLSADGKRIAPYYVLEYPDFVHVLAMTPDERIVLVTQYRHGLGKYTLELPGGMMAEDDAGPESAAMRELVEETGFTSPSHRLIASLSNDPAKFNNRTHLIYASDAKCDTPQNLDENEDIEISVVPIPEAIRLISDGHFINAAHIGMLMLGLNKLGFLRHS